MNAAGWVAIITAAAAAIVSIIAAVRGEQLRSSTQNDNPPATHEAGQTDSNGGSNPYP
jgi:hypothetical protein